MAIVNCTFIRKINTIPYHTIDDIVYIFFLPVHHVYCFLANEIYVTTNLFPRMKNILGIFLKEIKIIKIFPINNV